MRISIDVIFISKDNIVVYIIKSLRPWKVSPLIRKAYSVIELPIGTIEESKTNIGDRLMNELQ
jgi:hypothetical protein